MPDKETNPLRSVFEAETENPEGSQEASIPVPRPVKPKLAAKEAIETNHKIDTITVEEFQYCINDFIGRFEQVQRQQQQLDVAIAAAKGLAGIALIVAIFALMNSRKAKKVVKGSVESLENVTDIGIGE